MSEASEPSVGDLLAAADRDALRLLGDAEPSDGPALAAGWAQVLTAGYDVLAAIPTPAVDQPAATGGDYLSVRVAAMVSHVGSVKPLPLQPHPSTVRIADALRQAAAMVRRHADPAWMGNPVARADAAAARVRVARVLAAVAHVTARELQGYSRQLPGADPYLPGKPMPARVAAKWVRMTQRQEHLALDYLSGHLSDLAGEQRGASPDSAQLHSGLAAWSVLANRRTADPAVSASDLQHIASTQRVVLQAATVLADAASDHGELGPAAGPHLRRRLDDSAAQWALVAKQWTWLRTPDAAGADPATTRGSAAVLAAIDTGTRTGAASWASAEQVNDRLGGGAVVPLLRTITEASDVLAETYRQLPEELATAGRLAAPAAVLLHIAHQHEAAGNPLWSRPGTEASFQALPVSMHHVARHRLLPLTPPARQQLDTTSARLLATTQRARQALSVAVEPTPTPKPTPTHATPHPGPTRSQPHRHPHRPPPRPGLTP